MERLKPVGSELVRIIEEAPDSYADYDCDRCPCNRCAYRSQCQDLRPCYDNGGCRTSEENGLGRLFYCDKANEGWVRPQYRFIWKIMKNTDINNVVNTVKGFLKEWGDLDL